MAHVTEDRMHEQHAEIMEAWAATGQLKPRETEAALVDAAKHRAQVAPLLQIMGGGGPKV